MDSTKRFYQFCAQAVVILAAITLCVNTATAQNDPRYEIVVQADTSVFKFPEGRSEINVNELAFVRNDVDSVLKEYTVNSIRKAFPYFRQEDRIKITRTGQRVVLRDKSLTHIIRLDDTNEVNSATESFSKLEREKNGVRGKKWGQVLQYYT